MGERWRGNILPNTQCYDIGYVDLTASQSINGNGQGASAIQVIRPFWQINFWLLILGLPPIFLILTHTQSFHSFLTESPTKSTKFPRDLFLFILQPRQCLWFLVFFSSFLFFFPLINGVSDFKCYTGPPQNQFESLKLSQHQTVKVKMHYCGPAFVTFFNTHVTSL